MKSAIDTKSAAGKSPNNNPSYLYATCPELVEGCVLCLPPLIYLDFSPKIGSVIGPVGGSSRGRTTGSGPVNPGSNPGPPAIFLFTSPKPFGPERPVVNFNSNNRQPKGLSVKTG